MGNKRNPGLRGGGWAPYLFIVPAVALIVLLGVIPILISFVISLQSYRLGVPLDQIHYVGLDNYRDILSNRLFTDSIGWTFLFTAITVIFNLVLGLGLAMLLNAKAMEKRLKVFRSLFILPLMLAPVVTATIWEILFAPVYGIVNYVVELLGFASVSWTGESVPAKAAISAVDIWGATPFCMLIFLAAFQTVPGDVYEAAMIDGASRTRSFFRITLPLIRNFIALVVTIRVMDALRVFDSVMVLTNGGPGTATETMGTAIYKTAFRYGNIGAGSAGAFIFFALILVVTLVFMTLLRKQTGTEGREAA
ncbi:carbohydrate ABC transporter permease [Cohnella fermenti]|uniref:Sugar ABC transporter permease n=1 Tax=Cohnella fermenti TaxID=2565925 RepID=A0A4S4BYX4_9BACL|nr:sugar ABC transporter permease [Cohnella fermenti]THF80381.1 sugar ABC transporter permease [Cohnella fermenti]